MDRASTGRGGRRGCPLVVELGEVGGEGRILGRPSVEPSVDGGRVKSAGPRHRARGGIVLAGNPKVEVPIVPAVSSSATTVPQKASLEFIGFR